MRDSGDISGEPGEPDMPRSIEKQLDWDKYLLGDFVVCPLTRSVPGRMQIICIESVKNLVVRKAGMTSGRNQ